MKPSPMAGLESCLLGEDEDGVGLKNAWIELFLCKLAIAATLKRFVSIEM